MSINGEEIFQYADEDGDRIWVERFEDRFLIVAVRDSAIEDDEGEPRVRLYREQVLDLRDALNGWLYAKPEDNKEAPEPDPVKLASIPPERIRAAVLHLLRNDAEVFKEVAHSAVVSLKHNLDARSEVQENARRVFRHMFNLANNEIQDGDTQR